MKNDNAGAGESAETGKSNEPEIDKRKYVKYTADEIIDIVENYNDNKQALMNQYGVKSKSYLKTLYDRSLAKTGVASASELTEEAKEKFRAEYNIKAAAADEKPQANTKAQKNSEEQSASKNSEKETRNYNIYTADDVIYIVENYANDKEALTKLYNAKNLACLYDLHKRCLKKIGIKTKDELTDEIKETFRNTYSKTGKKAK